MKKLVSLFLVIVMIFSFLTPVAFAETTTDIDRIHTLASKQRDVQSDTLSAQSDAPAVELWAWPNVVTKGDDFEVYISASNVSDLYGFALTLKYDSDLVEVIDLNGNPVIDSYSLFVQNGDSFTVNEFNTEDPSIIEYAVARIDGSSVGYDLTNNWGDLGFIRFRVKDTATVPNEMFFQVSDLVQDLDAGTANTIIQLSDSAGNPISYDYYADPVKIYDSSMINGYINLTWEGTAPLELDAHLNVTNGTDVEEVAYFSTGSLASFPYAILLNDDYGSTATESIAYNQLTPGSTFFVENWDGQFPYTGTTVSVTVTDIDGTILDTFTMQPSYSQTGNIWNVFEVDQDGSLIPIDEMSNSNTGVYSDVFAEFNVGQTGELTVNGRVVDAVTGYDSVDIYLNGDLATTATLDATTGNFTAVVQLEEGINLIKVEYVADGYTSSRSTIEYFNTIHSNANPTYDSTLNKYDGNVSFNILESDTNLTASTLYAKMYKVNYPDFIDYVDDIQFNLDSNNSVYTGFIEGKTYQIGSYYFELYEDQQYMNPIAYAGTYIGPTPVVTSSFGGTVNNPTVTIDGYLSFYDQVTIDSFKVYVNEDSSNESAGTEITIDANGNFSVDITLLQGDNSVELMLRYNQYSSSGRGTHFYYDTGTNPNLYANYEVNEVNGELTVSGYVENAVDGYNDVAIYLNDEIATTATLEATGNYSATVQLNEGVNFIDVEYVTDTGSSSTWTIKFFNSINSYARPTYDSSQSIYDGNVEFNIFLDDNSTLNQPIYYAKMYQVNYDTKSLDYLDTMEFNLVDDYKYIGFKDNKIYDPTGRYFFELYEDQQYSTLAAYSDAWVGPKPVVTSQFGGTVSNPTLTINGYLGFYDQVSIDSFKVYVNQDRNDENLGTEITDIDANGNFSVDVTLQPGDNNVNLVLRYDNYSSSSIGTNIYYDNANPNLYTSYDVNEVNGEMTVSGYVENAVAGYDDVTIYLNDQLKATVTLDTSDNYSATVQLADGINFIKVDYATDTSIYTTDRVAFYDTAHIYVDPTYDSVLSKYDGNVIFIVNQDETSLTASTVFADLYKINYETNSINFVNPVVFNLDDNNNYIGYINDTIYQEGFYYFKIYADQQHTSLLELGESRIGPSPVITSQFGGTVSSPTLTINGYLAFTDDVTIDSFKVYVNEDRYNEDLGTDITDIDANGNFSVDVTLQEGDNQVDLMLRYNSGGSSGRGGYIYYDANAITIPAPTLIPLDQQTSSEWHDGFITVQEIEALETAGEDLYVDISLPDGIGTGAFDTETQQPVGYGAAAFILNNTGDIIYGSGFTISEADLSSGIFRASIPLDDLLSHITVGEQYTLGASINLDNYTYESDLSNTEPFTYIDESAQLHPQVIIDGYGYSNNVYSVNGYIENFAEGTNELKVFVNGIESPADLNANGTFSIPVDVKLGYNDIVVQLDYNYVTNTGSTSEAIEIFYGNQADILTTADGYIFALEESNLNTTANVLYGKIYNIDNPSDVRLVQFDVYNRDGTYADLESEEVIGDGLGIGSYVIELYDDDLYTDVVTYGQFFMSPWAHITNPIDIDQVVTSDQFTLEGYISNYNNNSLNYLELSINGDASIDISNYIDSIGHFAYPVTLEPGFNGFNLIFEFDYPETIGNNFAWSNVEYINEIIPAPTLTTLDQQSSPEWRDGVITIQELEALQNGGGSLFLSIGLPDGIGTGSYDSETQESIGYMPIALIFDSGGDIVYEFRSGLSQFELDNGIKTFSLPIGDLLTYLNAGDQYTLGALISKDGLTDASDLSNTEQFTYIDESVQYNSDATLSDLKVDGVTIDGFDSQINTYTVTLPAGTTAVPVVNATLSDSNATMNIANAASLPGTTTITVTAEDGTTISTYSVNFEIAPQKATVTVGSKQGTNGSIVEVPINIENGAGLAGLEFKLNYDPNIVTVNDVVLGDILSSFAGPINIENSGLISVALMESSLNGIDVNDYNLATIKFNIIGATDSYSILDLQGVLLSDPDGDLIATAIQNGRIDVISVIYGDVNEDQNVNIFDAMAILKHIVGKETLTGNKTIAADVTGDGSINIFDAMNILKYIVGEISTFPVETM